MVKKKLEVVELNKKEEKIVLKEKQTPVLSFWGKYRGLIFLTLLILSLTTLIVGSYLILMTAKNSEDAIIKEVSIETTLTDYSASIGAGNRPITEETAKNNFLNNGKFKSIGEVLLTKTVETSRYIIRFYSDGTAIYETTKSKHIMRIAPLENGNYGIDKFGVINNKAEYLDITVRETKQYPWGKVVYYSDGSAEIFDSKKNLFVRNSNDIKENYISNNKVSYLKETKNISNIKLNYYYDGTIEIIKDNQSYIIRNEQDIEINNDQINFKNNNQSTIINTKRLSDGLTIDYYTDGGAIIRDGSKTLSVRKSNSIIIKDNKIYEIVDNIYVEESYKSNDGNITYYTNGGAVAKYNGKTVYVEENSNIKYNQNSSINKIETTPENLIEERTINDENIKIFDKTAVIKTNDYIAIVPKEKVVFETDGSLKDIITEELDGEENTFKIRNSTNEKLKYRIVIKNSKRTNLDIKYIRYQLSTKNSYVEPTRLDNNIWKKDEISDELNVSGEHYILYDGELEPHDSTDIKLMLWTDYKTIPNSMQNKYFYGTIKVYAWTEK